MRSAREDPDAGRRLMYTAVTRAAERLALFHMH
jgi:superfamily I DNA/RNA helicase